MLFGLTTNKVHYYHHDVVLYMVTLSVIFIG